MVTFTGGRIPAYSGTHATTTGHCGPGTLSVALADFGDSSNGVYTEATPVPLLPQAAAVPATFVPCP